MSYEPEQAQATCVRLADDVLGVAEGSQKPGRTTPDVREGSRTPVSTRPKTKPGCCDQEAHGAIQALC